uniref:Uncharacterized protein n=1 Tax=Cacopsylla melanoneura TaxID=428564 RepID=A0A8D8TWK3_9HEMI
MPTFFNKVILISNSTARSVFNNYLESLAMLFLFYNFFSHKSAAKHARPTLGEILFAKKIIFLSPLSLNTNNNLTRYNLYKLLLKLFYTYYKVHNVIIFYPSFFLIK